MPARRGSSPFVIGLMSSVLIPICLAAGTAQAQPVPLTERLQLCAGCHAADGNSVIPENPKLAGQFKDYLLRQMEDFKQGKRKAPTMDAIMPLVDEKEFEALAEYFHEQKAAPGAALDPKLLQKGKEIYTEGIVGSALPACTGCHNEDGSGTEKYPRIAGQHPAYMAQQLMNYKSGARDNDQKGVMRAVAKRMNESEIRAVVEYVATLVVAEED